jgi:hypothetical protein
MTGGEISYSDLHDFIPDEALWNGTFLGKPVEQGVYAYIVEYTS